MRKARIQNIKCLFGMHDYGIPNKNNPDILMCKHCMKAGYRCDSVGVSYWYDYNENGNKIHLKTSRGLESWSDYDTKGNLIHYRNANGYERWYEYDKHNNKIHYKNTHGYEEWFEYEKKIE